jgi:superfamily II RNA helicase
MYDVSPPLAAPPPGTSADELLDRFLTYVSALGIELYPAQEEAILEIFSGKNVILNTPTGSGKSLVATAMHYKALADGGRSYYTSPIKALVSEKFFALCKDFGPENVAMVTGDASVNNTAPIVCCTAEILANRALREGSDLDCDAVIMDEFHYYADRERGWAWQVPLLTLPHARFLLMSATLGPVDKFVDELDGRTGVETKVVRGMHRPVPLEFEYRETPLHETVADLVNKNRAPIYLVNFTQRACAEVAQDLLSQDFASKEEKKAIHEALSTVRFESPYGKEMQRFLRQGIAVHHAGLLPKYRLLVEKLAQRGLLKVISGTDTLGVGVNIPLRTVLFTRLCKYDGEKTVILPVRDFQQISGRAGRKGFDDMGWVVAQAPEHVIENLQIDEKVAKDPSKKKKLVKKKPPDFGFLHWDRSTFQRLTDSQPEPLVSRFQINHGMILNVLERPRGGGCKALVRLGRDSHDTPAQKKQLRAHGMALFQSLIDAAIIERVDGRLQLHVDLQDDFSLHHALSLWLVDTVERLDRASDTYALDVLTLAEAIVENPDVILRAQLEKLRSETFARLKAEGVEFDERKAALEELEYPKPNREFIYDSFNLFAKAHPWVGENIRPKSIAREMFETLQTFSGYVKDYGLQRSEGVLLRYLSEVYKVMIQTVPALAKNDDVEDIIAFLGAIVRGTDASLLEEWERMRDPTFVAATTQSEEVVSDVTRDPRGFRILVRNKLHRLVQSLHTEELVLELIAELDHEGERWTKPRLERELAPFRADHKGVRNDRSPKLTRLDETTGEVQQIIPDIEGDDDWFLEAHIDDARSREVGEPVIVLRRIGH